MATTLTKIYSDIDFTFTKKPVVGDVALSYDVQAVTRSIRNILLTKHYDKPFNPDFGTNLDALLFENISPLTSAALENEVRIAIENFEPRAKIQSLVVQPMPDKNAYNLTMTFFVENAVQPTTITLLLERNR